MNKKINLSKEEFAEIYSEIYKDKLDKDVLDEKVEYLKDAKTRKYDAEGHIGGFFLGFTVKVKIKNGKSFKGTSPGFDIPGYGKFWGDLYTQDLGKLYTDTVAHMTIATPVYINIEFYDKKGKSLGNLHAGAVSTVVGLSEKEGKGKWK